MEKYRQILMEFPYEFGAAFRLEKLFEKERGCEGAEAFWKSLASRHPQAHLPHLFLGMSLEHCCRIDEALYAYETALQVDRFSGETLFRFGRLAAQEKRIDLGINALEQLYKKDPAYGQAILSCLSELAVSFSEMKDYPTAILAYEALTRLCPDDMDFMMQLGETYLLLGEKETARKTFERLLIQYPYAYAAAYRLADLYAEREECGEETEISSSNMALDFWNTLVQSSPRQELPLVFLGFTQLRSRNYSEARHAFQQALKINPHQNNALCGMGMMRIIEGDFDSGSQIIKNAVANLSERKHRVNSECTRLGKMFHREGMFDLAI